LRHNRIRVWSHNAIKGQQIRIDIDALEHDIYAKTFLDAVIELVFNTAIGYL